MASQLTPPSPSPPTTASTTTPTTNEALYRTEITFQIDASGSSPFHHCLVKATGGNVVDVAKTAKFVKSFLPTPAEILYLKADKEKQSSDTFLLTLAMTAAPAEAEHFQEVLLGFRGVSLKEKKTLQPLPLASDDPNKKDGEDLFKGMKPLQPCKHDYNNGAAVAELFPKISGNKIVVSIRLSLLAVSSHKQIIFSCGLIAKNEMLPSFKVIHGLPQTFEEDKTKVTKEKNLTLGAEVNSDLQAGLSLQLEVKNKVEFDRKDLKIYRALDKSFGEACLSICYKYAEKIGNQKPLLVFHYIFEFTMKDSFKPEEIRLDSHFLFKPRSTKDKVFQKWFRSTHSTNLRCDKGPPVDCIVVGGVVGFPKSGKTSFIDCLLRETLQTSSASIVDTAYLQKHSLDNVEIGDAVRTFSFLDTRGYYFDVDTKTHDLTDHDKEILRRFMQGLPEHTTFSKIRNLVDVPIDSSNSTSHIIIAVNIRDLVAGMDTQSFGTVTGIPWISSWLFPGSPDKGLSLDKCRQFLRLYEQVVSTLAEIRYDGKIQSTKNKVIILVTHLDMIESSKRSNAANQVKGMLKDGGVPLECVTVGSKDCEWDPKDLNNHEAKVAEFLKGVPKDQDYWEVLEELTPSKGRKYPDGFLHINEFRYCLLRNNKDHKHAFTPDTVASYKAVLSTLIK